MTWQHDDKMAFTLNVDVVSPPSNPVLAARCRLIKQNIQCLLYSGCSCLFLFLVRKERHLCQLNKVSFFLSKGENQWLSPICGDTINSAWVLSPQWRWRDIMEYGHFRVRGDFGRGPLDEVLVLYTSSCIMAAIDFSHPGWVHESLCSFTHRDRRQIRTAWMLTCCH